MPYIRHIRTTALRGIPPLEIDLAPAEGKAFRHLVLTGPNGTGKTSIVGAIAATVSENLADERPDRDDRSIGPWRTLLQTLMS